MTTIKVQRYYSAIFLLIAIVALILTIGAGIYFLFYSDFNFSARSRSDIVELISVIAFLAIPAIFSMLFSKEMYLAEIVIHCDCIDLIYKIKGRVVNKKRIFKKDVENFNIIAKLDRQYQGRSSYTSAKHILNIKTKNEEIYELHDNKITFTSCPYQLILDLIKNQNKIPNFSYEISGSDIYAKKDVEYFIQHGKRMPFVQSLKFNLSTMPKTAQICLIVIALILILNFCGLIYLLAPAPKLTHEEKLYMEHYNKALEYRIDDRDYYSAINELEKAERYFSNTSETHLEKAYNYKRLKEYEKGIKEAKEGLNYINSKSIYKKYHNFKFPTKEDISLYTVLGELYQKTKDYKNMKDCYNYVIVHNSYKYTDAYFKRGIARYYLLEFQEALDDFIKHKEIIEDYLFEESQSEYKAKYPTYDNKDIENINLWISATKKYGNL